jgi:hypothetical protein
MAPREIRQFNWMSAWAGLQSFAAVHFNFADAASALDGPSAFSHLRCSTTLL